MNPTDTHSLRWPAAVVLSTLIVMGWLSLSTVRAQAPGGEDIAAGMRIYLQKADCQACHGWAADGKKMDSQMPDGANLRDTKLNRNGLVMAVKCGIPGKSMPAFDRLAYSDGRCNGRTQADLKKLGSLPDPSATLQPREIEMVVDFLLAKVVGKGPMNRVRCIEYWGVDSEACAEFPK